VVNILILKESSYLFAPSNFLYIIASVLFGVVTNLVGGMYPAWKAGKYGKYGGVGCVEI